MAGRPYFGQMPHFALQRPPQPLQSQDLPKVRFAVTKNRMAGHQGSTTGSENSNVVAKNGINLSTNKEDNNEDKESSRLYGHVQRIKKLRYFLTAMGTANSGNNVIRKYEEAFKQEETLPKLAEETQAGRKVSFVGGSKSMSSPGSVSGMDGHTLTRRDSNARRLTRQNTSARLLIRQNTRAKIIQNKGFFRDLRKIGKFLCILIGLWKKHALRVQEFLQTSVQLINFEIVNEVLFDITEYKSDNQSRLSELVRMSLLKRPGSRTPEEVRHIEIALRNYPEIAAYPVRIQTLIAARCWYERYQGRRIIIRQGHTAQCFYFILSGSVLVTRMEPGSSMSRTLCYLRRGDSFGELAFLHKSPRAATCLSENSLELLVFGEEEYQSIFMSGGLKDPNDPILKSISCLENWPLDKLAQNSNKAVSSFFRRDTCLVRDSAASKWIYVIKSGSCTVLKRLEAVKAVKSSPLIDLRLKKFKVDTQILEVWLFNKFNEQERELFARMKAGDHIGLKSLGHINKAIGTKRKNNQLKHADSMESVDSVPPQRRALVTELKKPAMKKAFPGLDLPTEDTQATAPALSSNFLKSAAASKTKQCVGGEDTSIKDPVFVRIQILTKGDVFGLADLVHEDQPSLSLVSNGAECIMIDKHFYMQHMTLDMIRKLRHQVSPYPSEEVIQEKYEAYVFWDKHQKQIVQVTKKQLDLERDWRRGRKVPAF